MYLILQNKILDHFLGMPQHVCHYYAGGVADFAAGIEETVINESMSQNRVKLMNNIKEEFDMEDVKPIVIVKLPFKVQQQFFDPHLPDGPGQGLKVYPLLDAHARCLFYIFHVNLMADDLIHTGPELNHKEVPWQLAISDEDGRPGHEIETIRIIL